MPLTATLPQLFYEDRGAGEPLLVISGFALSSAVLEPMAELWSARFRCITYDHPGTGRSSKMACPVSTAGLAASATRLLDELDLDSAHIVGLSLGGAVAQEIALRFPHRVRGLILVGTSTSGPLSTPPDPRKLGLVAARILKESVQRRRLWFAPALFADGFAEREPHRTEAVLRPLMAHPAPPWSVAGQYLAAGLHDRALDLDQIRAPTLVLHGADDILVPVANAEKLARGIPDAELHVLQDAGHGLPFERSEETFELIGEWLGRRRPAAGDHPAATAARAERVTRALAVPLGAMRFGRSSVVLAHRALAGDRRTHRAPPP
jgi:pimeloyl-ACP methyl ester carboxylesterase